MHLPIITLAAALALVAGCERTGEPRTDAAPASASGATAPATAQSPTTPANLGPPQMKERKEGANPVQGQVDPKEAEQHRDFQRDGTR